MEALLNRLLQQDGAGRLRENKDRRWKSALQRKRAQNQSLGALVSGRKARDWPTTAYPFSAKHMGNDTSRWWTDGAMAPHGEMLLLWPSDALAGWRPGDGNLTGLGRLLLPRPDQHHRSNCFGLALRHRRAETPVRAMRTRRRAQSGPLP